jgi:hypothetical protein
MVSNSVKFVIVLNACGGLSIIKENRDAHQQIILTHCELNVHEYGHSVEHLLNILQAFAFCILIKKATTNKHIRLITILYDLFIS